MIEIWMKNYLVSDTNYNIVNLLCPKFQQELTNNVRWTSRVRDTTRVVYNYE
jgi:hypothetical protein